ncbi:MAG: hypothetical protein KDJ52_21430 [Anaerolineae bacterium]|nr:hypothetical protein [Anaerolineae bacterium]
MSKNQKIWLLIGGLLVICVCVLIGGSVTFFMLQGQTKNTIQQVTNVNPLGDTTAQDCTLRLTPARSNQIGAVWSSTKKPVQNGFETVFEFQLTELGGAVNRTDETTGGDGFTFIIQNDTLSFLGENGAGLGYPPVANSLAIEFDTWLNDGIALGPNLKDPNGNHISIHTRGLEPNDGHEDSSIGATIDLPDISDGEIHTVKIVYIPGTIEIFMDNLATPVLTVPVDLATNLNLDNGQAWVGFTASTGAAWENHDILNWTFNGAKVGNDCL